MCIGSTTCFNLSFQESLYELMIQPLMQLQMHICAHTKYIEENLSSKERIELKGSSNT